MKGDRGIPHSVSGKLDNFFQKIEQNCGLAEQNHDPGHFGSCDVELCLVASLQTCQPVAGLVHAFYYHLHRSEK
jgi:hypothetical protein